jgi:glycosyltransferase involved in cell wall biosynthesis
MIKSISIFIGNLKSGGAQSVCISLSNHLAIRGWKVDLIVLNLEESQNLERINCDVEILSLGVKKARFSFMRLLSYFFKKKPHLVVSFDYEMAIVLVFLKLFFNFKFILRNINTVSRIVDNSRKAISRYVIKNIIYNSLNKSDFIINQCQAMEDDLLVKWPIFKSKSVVIYNPVSDYIQKYVSYNQLRNSNLIVDEYILCVGRLESQKSFQTALIAFSTITKRFPRLRLKLVGDGSELNNLRKLSFDLGINHLVDFEGVKTDLISIYVKAKLTLLTSTYEGFPNVLIESITLGTPVVSFDCPSGPKEIIVNGVNGFLVINGSVSDLVDKLISAVQYNWDELKIRETSNQYRVENYFKEFENTILKSFDK